MCAAPRPRPAGWQRRRRRLARRCGAGRTATSACRRDGRCLALTACSTPAEALCHCRQEGLQVEGPRKRAWGALITSATCRKHTGIGQTAVGHTRAAALLRCRANQRLSSLQALSGHLGNLAKELHQPRCLLWVAREPLPTQQRAQGRSAAAGSRCYTSRQQPSGPKGRSGRQRQQGWAAAASGTSDRATRC